MAVAELPADTTRLEPKTVGRVLRRIRERRGETQEEIAEALGMSTSGYGHYENGRARLTLHDLPRFALALRITTEELMEELGVIAEVAEVDRPTIEMIVRSIRRSPELSDDDKDLLARLVERSRRIARGEPDPYPDD